MSLFGTGARIREPEFMDDADLDETEHLRALRGLARLNAISRSVQIVWKPIERLARGKQQRLRVLDIASGGGEMAIDLWRKAARKKISLDILGTDVSPRAVECARSSAAQRGAPVEFCVCDALNDGLPVGFDVVVTSLFFHHLADDQATTLLRQMAETARRLVPVNDLHRSPAALALVAAASRIVTTSPVVHIDAVRSVRAGFTAGELRSLAAAAGIEQAEVTRRHPCHLLLSWQRP